MNFAPSIVMFPSAPILGKLNFACSMSAVASPFLRRSGRTQMLETKVS